MPFQIFKQTDVSDVSAESVVAAEHDDELATCIVHRTKAGAVAAMKAMVPEGESPRIYAGLFVRQVPPTNLAVEVE